MKRNRHKEKMTLLGFVRHGRIQWIGRSLFRYWRSSVNFCHDKVSAGAPVKGTILTLKTQTLTIFNSETCSVDDTFCCTPYVEFHRFVSDEWLKEKRCYSDVSFPTRQRHVNT